MFWFLAVFLYYCLVSVWSDAVVYIGIPLCLLLLLVSGKLKRAYPFFLTGMFDSPVLVQPFL